MFGPIGGGHTDSRVGVPPQLRVPLRGLQQYHVPSFSRGEKHDAEAIDEGLEINTGEMGQVSRRAVSQGERCRERP